MILQIYTIHSHPDQSGRNLHRLRRSIRTTWRQAFRRLDEMVPEPEEVLRTLLLSASKQEWP
jgi:hypothetical protein